MSHWIFSLLTIFHFVSLFSESIGAPNQRSTTIKTVQKIPLKPVAKLETTNTDDYTDLDLLAPDSEEENDVYFDEPLQVKEAIRPLPKPYIKSSASRVPNSILPIGFAFLFVSFSWK